MTEIEVLVEERNHHIKMFLSCWHESKSSTVTKSNTKFLPTWFQKGNIVSLSNYLDQINNMDL